MGVKLSEKRNESKTITVKWGEDSVDLAYKANAVTPKLLEDVDAAATKDDLSSIGLLLEPVIDWWDVLDDEGQRIGTDQETIRTLPMRWLVAVQRALEDDQRPPESTDPGGSFGG